MGTTKVEGARARLLAAADELFYAEGIHTVGIDRVIAQAGVAKASLYNTFKSKDELVLAYLEMRAERRKKRILERLAMKKTPEDKVYAVFELMGEIASEPGYRGCAFVNASAEGDRAKVASVCQATRTWTRSLFTDLAREHGVKNADETGRQLGMLYDGLLIANGLDATDAKAIKTRVKDARTIARLLLSAEH